MNAIAITEPVPRAPRFRVLGVAVSAVQISDAIAQVEEWLARGETGHYITVTGMHGVTESLHDPKLRDIHNAASLVVPDGMPLVWLGRHYGYRSMRRRVYGPELMEALFRQTGSLYRHFLYGGAPGVAGALAEKFTRQFGAHIVGTYSPPFRPLSEEEEQELADRVRAASPDLLWVGLSTPKQERWMYAHRDRLRVPVMLGVGAAFDFHTGQTRQAPRWMREHGLEWFFRLSTEPRRLWRRYIIYGSQFAWNVSLQVLKLKEFN